ncbi:hypothetical protein GpartN1_g1315.t1 [Galdieria partita]|uniref:Uncharacterized protein n=1 Tax=Galdieria partita TaxID=83374 RepID=A0A9C7PS90_9RHOD|nr:hypothetical protein GpartN1_g1315.t1 [Galdieria partita]
MKSVVTPLKKRNDWRQSNCIPEEIRNYAKSIHLLESNDGSSYFYCPFCKISVEPTKSFLQKHVSDVKHRKKTTIYNSENIFPFKRQSDTVEWSQQKNREGTNSSSHYVSVTCSNRNITAHTLSTPYTERMEVSPFTQKLVQLQESCYCFYCSYYFYHPKVFTDSEDIRVGIPSISPLSLKDVLVDSQPVYNSEYCESLPIVEPPWLSSTIKDKFGSESIYHCLSEELKLFEHYVSYKSSDVNERREVMLFVKEKLHNLSESSVHILDDLAIPYCLPFDSILLSLTTTRWNSMIEQRLLQQLNQNNNHWQFCKLSRAVEGQDMEILWILEQVVGVSIQVLLFTGNNDNISSFIDKRPLLFDVMDDSELRGILLCLKYMIYLQQNVCHFSDIYVSWLLLQNKKVWSFLWGSFHQNNTRGYLLMHLLYLLGDLLSYVACGYSEDCKLFALSRNEKYLRDIYGHFAVLCRQAYQSLTRWDKQNSPIAFILPCNEKFLSLITHCRRRNEEFS